MERTVTTYRPVVDRADVESHVDLERTEDGGWKMVATHEWCSYGDALDDVRAIHPEATDWSYNDLERRLGPLTPATDRETVQHRYVYRPSVGEGDDVGGRLGVYEWGTREYDPTVGEETQVTKGWVPTLEGGECEEVFVSGGVVCVRDVKYVGGDSFTTYEVYGSRPRMPMEWASAHHMGWGEWPSPVEQIESALRERHPSTDSLDSLVEDATVVPA